MDNEHCLPREVMASIFSLSYLRVNLFILPSFLHMHSFSFQSNFSKELSHLFLSKYINLFMNYFYFPLPPPMCHSATHPGYLSLPASPLDPSA